MLKFLVISGPVLIATSGYLILVLGKEGPTPPEALCYHISVIVCDSFCDCNVLSFFTVGVEGSRPMIEVVNVDVSLLSLSRVK